MTVITYNTFEVLGLLGILTLLILGYRFYASRSVARYPPGPPLQPLVGNILEVTAKGSWTKYTEYKGIYGDLVFFHGLGNSILVLNSMDAVSDLLEKRGNIYSDRPHLMVVGEMMGLAQAIPMQQYGDEWRIQRKLAHTALSISTVQKYHVIQEDLAALMSRQILETPQDFFSHVRVTAERLILSITYGLSVDAADSKYITQADETMEIISQSTVPGAFLADFIPWMRYLPWWLPFQKAARRGHDSILKMVTVPFEHVKREMAAGSAPPSLVQDLLSSPGGDSPELQHHIKWMSGSLYGAAGETTYATVLTCILAMALHPDKQRKAQEELDNVIGDERMPMMTDRDDLPYINALIKETMRWHPVLPLSLARRTTADDVYNGYVIPEGTIVMPNLWAIAFEPKGPYHPQAFEPERFLVENKEDLPTDPADWAFGFARRKCPGKHMGENSLFIFISTLLSMFDITPPDNGRTIAEFTQDLVSYPKPFNCKITPRSAAKGAQIRERAAQSSV
ncbi:cytochrome P450 [Trametes meyenii]|nr:cytochrome P450 [Trametes meyenii]